MDEDDPNNLSPQHGAPPLKPGLYIVATPIGHARDITLRALDVLAQADLVLCEDTRVSQKLLSRYRLTPPCQAYHEHNAEKMRPKILARLAAGERIALISDAGTPLISDPGMPLVRAARADGHYVTGLPGASAPILALSMAGLPTDRFCFAGFLPPKQSGRRKALQALLQAPTGTLVVFEAARRLTDLLGDLHSLAPQAEICVARELTKKFETLRSGSAEDLLAYFENDPPRGEVTVLISAAPMEDAPSETELDAMLRDAMAGMSRRDAVQNIAELTGLPRKQVYARALLLGEEPLNNMSDTMSGGLSGGADTVLNEKEEEEDNEEQEEPAFDGSAGEAGPV